MLVKKTDLLLQRRPFVDLFYSEVRNASNCCVVRAEGTNMGKVFNLNNQGALVTKSKRIASYVLLLLQCAN